MCVCKKGKGGGGGVSHTLTCEASTSVRVKVHIMQEYYTMYAHVLIVTHARHESKFVSCRSPF